MRAAQRAGEIDEGTDAPQLVFELTALIEMANAGSVLHDEFTCYDKAAKAVLNRLRGAATDKSLLSESP